MDHSRYPTNWKAISKRIRERDGNRCAWCGVANGAVGYREPDGRFVQLAASKEQAGMDVEYAALDGVKVITIVLTVAHLGVPHPDGTPGNKHDKHDCRDENLAALCQKCHLCYDRDEHAANAAETRRRKQIETGQTELAI